MSTAATAITYKVPKRRHPVLLFMLQQPLGAAGLAVIIVMAGCAAFAPWGPPPHPPPAAYYRVLLVSVFFVLVNFVMDMMYAFLDPRIRYR